MRDIGSDERMQETIAPALIPAKAGIQKWCGTRFGAPGSGPGQALDPRFRGGDEDGKADDVRRCYRPMCGNPGAPA